MIRISFIQVYNPEIDQQLVIDPKIVEDLGVELDKHLLEWSDAVPLGESVHLTFEIHYEDHNVVKGSYELKNWFVEYPSLQRAIKVSVKFYSGKARPKDWTEKQYQKCLSQYSSMQPFYKEIEEKYEY